MKVLIVDDETYMVEYLKKLVSWEDYGFDCVLTAGGGSLASDLLKRERPQLLVTDIKMPRVSGLDLARMLDENGGETRVIIVSGYSDFEFAQTALRYGAVEYLLKPVLKEDLEEALGRLFKKNPVLRRELPEVRAREHWDIVDEVKKYVFTHFDGDLSLTEIGDAVHLHPAYLSKVFKDATGKNLSSYITDIRMEKAAELLVQTSLHVRDIMEMVGYQKSQYFGRLFREKYGMTPKEYRQKAWMEGQSE